MSNLFDTYFLPISGIDFVRYIAIYSVISKYNLVPKRIYCASGGCLASYLAMMSSFTSSIENWRFNSDMIFKKMPFTDPRVLTFVLNGFFYRRRDLTEFMKKTFIPQKCQDVEIISGFFDQANNMQRINISTNFTKTSSILGNFNTDDFIGKNLIITFAEEFSQSKTIQQNYDTLLNHISECVHSTTNIPLLIEPLGKNQATDFGIVAPCPQVTLKADPSKSIYFSPIDITDNNLRSEYITLFHHFILKDIMCIGEKFSLNTEKGNLDDVMEFIRDQCSRYCLVIYSKTIVTIQITNFSESDVINAVNHCKNSISFKLFYDPL